MGPAANVVVTSVELAMMAPAGAAAQPRPGAVRGASAGLETRDHESGGEQHHRQRAGLQGTFHRRGQACGVQWHG
jgi:hypothetical protein